MAPKSLEPWLAHFLRDEIAAVIDWQRQAVPGIKPDPECRFSDDGSNFRCEIETPPGAAEVQLIEVLTVGNVVTVYVSDGNIKVKARLSPDAVATFEEETGDTIALEVSGDVLQLKKFTIISTPFGPPDGFVQLHIDELEHRTLLRRTFGNPSPVEENYSVRVLVESIKQLRIPEASSQHDPDRLHPEADLPKAAKPSVSATTVSPPPLAIQTQAPAEPKSRGPTLRRDGYEVESGLNLQGPVGPNFQGKPNAASKKLEDDSHLLGLFRKVKAPASVPNAHAVNVKARRTSPAPQKAASVVSISSATPANALDSAALVLQDSSAASPRPAVSPVRSTNSVAAVIASQHEPSSGQPSIEPRRGAVLKDGKSFFAYARIKVPDSQRRLLDSNSWLPALPGKQFPSPNVPRELLMRWNVEAAASDTDLAVSQRSAASQKSAPLQEAMSVSDSDSEGSDTASQEPTPSPSQHWRPKLAAIPHSSAINSTMESDGSMADVSRPSSASPLQHVKPVRPDLPPSSTLGSVVRATPTDGELEVTTPRPLPSGRLPYKRGADELVAPSSKRQAFTPRHAAVTSGPVAGLRHPLPSRPMLPPSPSPASGQRSPQHASSIGMLSQCVHDTPARSFQQDSPRAATNSVGLVGTEPSLARSHPSQHPSSRSSQPTPAFRESAQMTKPSSLSAGRYATTQPKQDGRRATTPPERFSHPVMEQQQARKNFMNQERRKNWMKTLYIPGTDDTVRLGTVQLATVLAEYKKEHPGDSGVKLDDLLWAAQEVYGRTDLSGPGITATTFYVRKPPTPNFSIQAEDGSAVLFRRRIMDWIRSRYEWDAKGDCHVADMWTAYAQHLASKPDAALQAAHGIFHSAVKSAFTMEDKKKYNLWKFTELRDDSKAAMQGAVKTSSSMATSSVVPTKNGLAQSIGSAKVSTSPTCEHDIADTTRSSKEVSAPGTVDEGSTDRRRRPGLSSNVSMATEDGFSDCTDSMATFCASYLELGSGKSNAFGSAVPGKNTKNNLVDVLRWNL